MSILEVKIPEGRKWHRCVDCGDIFTLSYRASGEMRKSDREPRCMLCQHPATVIITDSMVSWWRDRFSEDEIVEMAEAMWGPRKTWVLS